MNRTENRSTGILFSIVQYTTEEHSMQLESTGGMGADLFVRTKVKEVVAQSDAGTLIPRGVRNNLK